AAEAMRAALAELHANPSSMHREGQRARAAIERARDQVAGLVGARPDEIVFTSGGTEGDHMGLIGAALALDPRGRRVAISAHKLGGPKGVGALVIRRGVPFEPLFRGSAHERGRRGGTENLPGIVGLGEAAEHAARELARENPRLLELRDRLERGIRAALPDVVYHGETSPRLPNTLNLSVPGARSDHLLMALDARGVAASAGAACASGAVEPSPVLTAMGVPRAMAICALRLSMGRTKTPVDVG